MSDVNPAEPAVKIFHTSSNSALPADRLRQIERVIAYGRQALAELEAREKAGEDPFDDHGTELLDAWLKTRGKAPTVVPESGATAQYLMWLDPKEERAFSFQTFDDNEERKRALDKTNAERKKAGKAPLRDPRVRVLHGIVEEHWHELVRLNALGAGIFVTVNETDLKGRKGANVIRVRALFVDLDGAPLEPVMQWRKPHMVVESSPGRFHCYWLVSDVELSDFAGYQKQLAERFGGDPKVHDLPRVLRLPGFVHRKGVPFLSHVCKPLGKMPPYKVAELFADNADEKVPDQHRARAKIADHFAAYVAAANTSPWDKLNTEALQKLDLLVPVIFPEATSRGKEGWRVTSAMLAQYGRPDFEEDLSFHPTGITDYGYTGEDINRRPIIDPLGQDGGRTMLDIVQLYVFKVPITELAFNKQNKNRTDEFDAAIDWLSEKLGHPTENKDEYVEPSKEKIEPVDLWGHFEAPPLPRGLLPKLIEDYAFTLSNTMGADPAGIAMSALTVCAASIPDDKVKLQMKQHDVTWKEAARIWASLVGLPSSMKSPGMLEAAKPIRERDRELLKAYLHQKHVYDQLEKKEKKAATPPLQKRLCLEDVTIESTQDVLAGSPAGVLLYQDELSAFFGSMDKYAGNRGAAKDRGFWLQTWNGGPSGSIPRFMSNLPSERSRKTSAAPRTAH